MIETLSRLPYRAAPRRRVSAGNNALPAPCDVTMDETIAPVVALRDCVNPGYKPLDGRMRRLNDEPSRLDHLNAALAAVRDADLWDALSVEAQAEHGTWLMNYARFWNRLTIAEKARAGALFAGWTEFKDEWGVATIYTLVSPHTRTTYRLEFDAAVVGMRCGCPAGMSGEACYHVLMFPAVWLRDMMDELEHLAVCDMERHIAEQERETFAFESLQYGEREPMRQLRSESDWG